MANKKNYGIPEVPEDALERKVKWSYPKQIEKLENRIAELKQHVYPGKNVQELLNQEISVLEKQLNKRTNELVEYQEQYNRKLMSDNTAFGRKLEEVIREEDAEEDISF